jgi:biopolymer transport protein ExbB
LIDIIRAAGWPIWPLIICSILTLAIVIERWLTLKSDKIVPPKLLSELSQITAKTLPDKGLLKQIQSSSELGYVLGTGLQAFWQNPHVTDQDLRESMEGAGRLAAAKLEKRLTLLATIASAAPLIGLLGTVIGMIEIFGAQSSGATGSSGGDPVQLAHGISIALYNTAFGLIVAIPALMFWRYFRSQVDGFLLSMEVSAQRFARHLSQLKRAN